ncbi:glycolipid 2-alpha-mannosyltransferase-domain-containing protein [Polychytrium aggregatum]|uniref:glycolipid 2-alpha-mannosyltransferase-domain-containing protein n=1 Tax=Polychytrium aggregatum TaxID=110093 RepID=UPI0022FEE857|nr:glycolipid 2-alpha-mannosyltransferase-domain-containing protein [Polychytrium aggregatum]KAI9207192.1 glycolipid 2-alpha-mannosyltransferase-domain-containing protein [Polychytrium aggregatum]
MKQRFDIFRFLFRVSVVFMVFLLYSTFILNVKFLVYRDLPRPPAVSPRYNTSTDTGGSVLAGEIRPQPRESIGQENACIVMLVRNSERWGALSTLRTFEATFNAKYQYPYYFFNNEPFDKGFKDAITMATSAPVYFEQLAPEHWSLPPTWDRAEFLDSIKNHPDQNARKESYHYMCRFYSGFMAVQPALKSFKYYWRIEPDVIYYCPLNYDPFELMRVKKKRYGFNIVGSEIESTIPTLWPSTLEYLRVRNLPFPPHLRAFERERTDPSAPSEYNLAHFWSNFEIGDLDFFRSREYQDYFYFLDSKGGFFTERWGDAPVHSLAVGLFMDPSEVHYFYDIGYNHGGYMHCPEDIPSHGLTFEACKCNPHVMDLGVIPIDRVFWGETSQKYLAFLDEYHRNVTMKKSSRRA